MKGLLMTEDEKFAIFWCFNNAMKYVDKYSPIYNPYGPVDTIVNGINFNETIKVLLGKLFV